LGITDFGSGGSSQVLGQTAPGTFTNSIAGNAPQGGRQQGAVYQPSGGQRYQVPAGYQGSAAGSVIDYGGAAYTAAGDGTMTSYSRGYQGVTPPSGGQAYQIPAGYEGYGAGSVINYGGASYTAAGDGTMTAFAGEAQGASQPAAGQRYQVPAGYEGYGAGSLINYGGASYVINGDGTMTTSTGAALAATSTGAAPAATSTAPAPAATNNPVSSTGPVSGQRYKVPAQYATSTPGSIVTYEDHKYIVNNDATMTAISDQALKATQDDQAPVGPIPGKRYQIPAEFAKSAAGTVIKYGEYKYLANTDGTMTAFADKGAQP